MKYSHKILNLNRQPANIQNRMLQWLMPFGLLCGLNAKPEEKLFLTELIVDGSDRKIEKDDKVAEMRSTNILLKWMVLLTLLFVGMGAIAEESTDPKQTVCPGPEPYRVEVKPDTGNNYLWTISGGTEGIDYTISNNTAPITTITWTNPATTKIFIVIFKEIDPVTGCSDDQNVEVTVNPLPADPLITGLPIVCQNDAGVIYSTPNVAGNSYSWLVSRGMVTNGAGTNQITVTWDTAGAGTVEVTETITATSCSKTASIPVDVNMAPALVITDPLAVCSPGTIDLEAAAVTLGSTLPTGTVLTYWKDALATTALASPTAVTTSGTYYIKAETAEGCRVIGAVKVTVYPMPAPVIIYHR